MEWRRCNLHEALVWVRLNKFRSWWEVRPLPGEVRGSVGHGKGEAATSSHFCCISDPTQLDADATRCRLANQRFWIHIVLFPNFLD